RTPAMAILVVGAVAIPAVFLGEAILEPITNVGSFTCTLGWLATCVAYCYGAAGPLSHLNRAVGVLGALITAAIVLIVVSDFGRYEWLDSAAWAACGLVLWLTRRPEKKDFVIP